MFLYNEEIIDMQTLLILLKYQITDQKLIYRISPAVGVVFLFNHFTYIDLFLVLTLILVKNNTKYLYL